MGSTSSGEVPEAWSSGLNDLTKGCHALRSLELSDDAADVLATIKQGIEELEARARETCKWERSCPNGGKLLRVQACLAAGNEQPPEWSMGYLFVGSEEFLFESSDAPIWAIGPCRWTDLIITQQPRAEGSLGKKSEQRQQCDISLRFTDTIQKTYMLSGIGDIEWLMSVWNQSWSASGHVPPIKERIEPVAYVQDSQPANIGESENTFGVESWLQQWPHASLDSFESEADVRKLSTPSHRCSPSLGSPLSRSQRFLTSSFQIQSSPSLSSGKDRAASLVSSRSFFEKTDMLPEVQPVMDGPVFSMRFPNATMDGIRAVLEASEKTAGNDFFKDYFQTCMNASEISATSWVDSHRVPGTRVRRLLCRMDTPKDLPSFVTNVLAMPQDSAVTLLARLGSSGSKLALLQQSCCHDVPFGENCWFQEVLMFQPHPGGGIQLEKFADVIWVSPLPWALKMVGMPGYIESQAKTESASDKWKSQYLETRSKAVANPS